MSTRFVPPHEMRARERWMAAAGLMLGALALTRCAADYGAPPTFVRGDATTIVLFAASVAFSAASQYLAQRRSKNLLRDSNPPTTSDRGSYVPWVVGRRRLGPVVLWVEGSGGGGGPQFLPGGDEAQAGKRGSRAGAGLRGRAWHGLAVGPASRIRRVYVNGKVILNGELTPESSPSGTAIALAEGTFRVYWGEPDQPIDSLLSTNIVASRWPYLCSVVWDTFYLGDTPQWPLIEYEVEVQPRSELKLSPALVADVVTDAGASAGQPIVAFDTGGATGRRVEIVGRYVDEFLPSAIVRLSEIPPVIGLGVCTTLYGSAGPLYVYIYSAVYDSTVQPAVTRIELGVQTTRPIQTPQTPISGNRIAACVFSGEDGINLAHAIDHLLFQPGPMGLAQPRDLYDIASLEQLGVLIGENGENLRGHVIAQDGETGVAVLAGILQDVSCFLSHDIRTGLLRFVPVRQDVGTLPHIPSDLLCDPGVPELEDNDFARAKNKLVFTFPYVAINYREMTFALSDDGKILSGNVANADDVKITSTTHYPTAHKIGVRRQQEVFGQLAKRTLVAQRDATYLVPGQAFSVEGIEGTMRHFSVQRDLNTSAVTIRAFEDMAALPLALLNEGDADDGVTTHFGISPPIVPVAEDLAVGLFALPAHLRTADAEVVMFRVRAASTIVGAHVWISTDGTSYKRLLRTTDGHAAVTLTGALAGVASGDLTASVATTQLGLDLATVAQDLSGSEDAWRAGQQIAVCEGEVMFLESVTAGGGGAFTLNNLLRGRLGTAVAAHAPGAIVYIASYDHVVRLKDALIQPGKTLHVKSQPFTTTQEMPVQEATDHTIVLAARAAGARGAITLSTQDLTNGYVSGETVPIVWTYKNDDPALDAGAPISGYFRIEVINLAGPTVVRTVLQTTTGWSYTGANRSTDFGGETAQFGISVTYVDGGIDTASATATIVRVT